MSCVVNQGQFGILGRSDILIWQRGWSGLENPTQPESEVVLSLHGYGVASLFVLLGVEGQQLGVLDVVTSQVEIAVELLPGPAVVVNLEPGLPFAPVEAGQEFWKPGGVDVGAVFSQSRHGITSQEEGLERALRESRAYQLL